ncbi:hypothetical protein PS2_031793 [Malus domestica]
MSRRKWVPNWRSKEKNESPTNPDATVVIRPEAKSQLACRSNICTEAASTTPTIAVEEGRDQPKHQIRR